MSNEMQPEKRLGLMERVVVQGNLSELTPEDRTRYYSEVCKSLGLNPLTRPFEYLVLNDKLTLYARKDCTDQLREIHKISVKIVAREKVEGVYVVTASATTPDGRQDESIGAVSLVKEDGEWKTSNNGKRYFAKNGNVIPLRGDELANAMMKAESKSKRRVTLSICGLGLLDESEIETIPDAKPMASPNLHLPEPAGPQLVTADVASYTRKWIKDIEQDESVLVAEFTLDGKSSVDQLTTDEARELCKKCREIFRQETERRDAESKRQRASQEAQVAGIE